MRRLKVLWLSHFVPYPPKGGAFQRSFNIIRGIGAVHELHLLALRHKIDTHPPEETSGAAEELARFCKSIRIIDGTRTTLPRGLATRLPRLVAGVPLTVSVSDLSEMHQAIGDEVCRHSFDLVHFDTIGLACYLGDVVGIPSVINHHNAESFMMRRRTKLERSQFKRILFLLEAHMLRQYEAKMCPRFKDNFVVSELDAQQLSEVAPSAHYSVIPNGVDIDYFKKMPPVSNHRMVFAGRLDQYSNRDAILYFIGEIWPRILKSFPDASLDILGSNATSELNALAHRYSSIRLRGFVPDIRPYFQTATVAVCPIRDGGGTRLKILDNLAMGKPIVTTTIGIEGIAATPERDLLVADSPEDFAAQVARVFTDEALRGRLSEAARRLAEERYSWTSIIAYLLGRFQTAAVDIGPTNW